MDTLGVAIGERVTMSHSSSVKRRASRSQSIASAIHSPGMVSTPGVANQPPPLQIVAQLEEVDDLPSGHFARYTALFGRHKHEMLTYCMVFWCFGMCVAFLGPTLLDLGCKTSSSFATMSYVFFCQTLFIMIGSICGGFLAQWFSEHPVLFFSTGMLSVTMALIPFCDHLATLALTLAVMGFFMGIVDTVANVSMIKLYGKEVSPFLQTLHFFYGLGAFMSPMITEPFLLNEDCSVFIDNSSHMSGEFAELAMSEERRPAKTLEQAKEMTNIDYGFWIMALLQMPVAFLCFSLIAKQVYKKFCVKPSSEAKDKEKEYHNMDRVGSQRQSKPDVTLGHGGHPMQSFSEEEFPISTLRQTVLVTFLSALMLFIYDGLQAGYGGFIYSYAVKSVSDLNPSEAAYLNACFWGSFAFGRLISIGLATRLAPNFMLGINIVGCFSAMCLMILMKHNHSALYFGTLVFGFFLSSVYPTVISLAEQYINVSSHVASCMVVGASTGEMIMPVLVGHEFDRVGPVALLYICCIMGLVSVVVYVILWVVGRSILRDQPSQTSMFGVLSTFVTSVKGGGPLSQPPATAIAVHEDSGLIKHQYYSRMRSEQSDSSLNCTAGGATVAPNGTTVQHKNGQLIAESRLDDAREKNTR